MRNFRESSRDVNVSLFVHFDFEFFPLRVHSGQVRTSWEGHEWEGIGDVLEREMSSQWIVLSRETKERGKMSASLPITKELKEVLDNEYYRDRGMEWMICAVNGDGTVNRRLCVNSGRIDSYRRKEDYVTFTAECGLLNSQRTRDDRHKSKVEAVRQRFKWNLADSMKSNGLGWVLGLVELLAGGIGLLVKALKAVVSSRNRRIIQQRWSARQKMYRFRTDPRIPGMKMPGNGYNVRADTLDAAKRKLYATVAKRVWEISPNFVGMIVYWEGRPLEYLNLDTLRKNDDPERYEETDPMGKWPP